MVTDDIRAKSLSIPSYFSLHVTSLLTVAIEHAQAHYVGSQSHAVFPLLTMPTAVRPCPKQDHCLMLEYCHIISILHSLTVYLVM